MRACFMTSRSDVFWSTNKARTTDSQERRRRGAGHGLFAYMLFSLPNAHTAHNLGLGQRELDDTSVVRFAVLSRARSAAQKHGRSGCQIPLACGRDHPRGFATARDDPMSPMGRVFRNFRPSIPGSLTAAKGQSPAAKVG